MADFLKTSIENSQWNDAIKQETLKILAQAEEVKEKFRDDESVVKEYSDLRYATIWALVNLKAETQSDLDIIKAELWQWWSIDAFKYSEGDIDSRELEDISRESDELKTKSEENNWEWETASIIFGNTMLWYIQSTNDRILTWWDAELEKELDWYLVAFWEKEAESFFSTQYAAYTAANVAMGTENLAIYASMILEIKNSANDTYTKLFQLSQALFIIGKECWAWGALETAHNEATKDIIRKVIENDDWNFAIGFDSKTWYFMSNEISSNSSELEIGTYLCSLNKSGKLNKDNLLKPNWPFSPTELFQVLERYKNWAFGWVEIQWLFLWYLNWFEDTMNMIAQDYLANEENWSHIIDFFNAQTQSGNTHPLYWEEDIVRLTENTKNLNIWTIENVDIRERILVERRIQAGKELTSYLKQEYIWGPDIWDILSAIIQTSLEWTGKDFDFSGINQIISEYNESVWVNWQQYPLIVREFKDIIEKSLSSFYDAQMLTEWFSESLKILQEIKATWDEKVIAMQRLQQNLIAATDPNTIAKLRSEIDTLRQESFIIQRKVETAEGNLNAAEKETQQELTRWEESVNLFQSFRWSSIKIDIKNPIQKEFVLEKPRERVILMKSAEDLLEILKECDDNSVEIFIDDINPEFLVNWEILSYFLKNDKYRDTIISRFPVEIFKNQELCLRIFENSEFHWWALIQNIYSANKKDDAVNIINGIISQSKNLETEEKRIKLEKFIPREIYVEIVWREFDDNTDTIKDFETFSSNIEHLIKNREALVINQIWTYSPLVVAPIQWDMDMNEDTKANTIDQLLLFIRYNGLNDEILWEVQKLFDSGNTSTLTDRVLWMLTPLNRSHLDFGIKNISWWETKDNNSSWETKDNNSSRYLHLNASMKSNPEIIQKMWEYGLSEFKPYVIRHITNEKIFAQYLIGYSKSGNNIRELQNHTQMSFLKTRIQWDWDSLIFTEEEKQELDKFYQRTQDIRNLIDIKNNQYEQISEVQKNSIITILEDEWLTEVEVKTILPKDFQDIAQLEVFLLQLDTILGEKWKLDSDIDAIITKILEINLKAQKDRVQTDSESNAVHDYSPDSLHSLWELWLINEWNWIPDTSAIVDNYLEKNWINNFSYSEIEIFLLSLWVKEEDIKILSPTIYNKIKLVVDREVLRIQRERDPNKPYSSQPGLYSEAMKGLDIKIKTGDFSYETYISNNSQQNKNTTTPQLTANNISSPDLRDTYRELSSELSLTQEEAQSLTQEELKLIASDESIKESFISFKSTLDELNLESIWQFRNQIFRAIWSLNFNISDGDYIGENELNIFLSKVTYATLWKDTVPELKSTPSNLVETARVIRRENNIWFLWQVDESSVWEGWWVIETKFREKFAPKDAWFIWFKTAAFLEALKS